jgi:hypothetical protein
MTSVAFGQRGAASCAAGVLPKSVAERLKSQFPEWRIRTTGDLEPYDRQWWIENKPDTCPGIASGRFLRPDARAVAVLLVPKAPDAKGFMVLVFDPSDMQRGPAPIVVERVKDQSPAAVVIFRVPPGVYRDPDRTRRVRIVLDGIEVVRMEASGTLYFWRRDHFEDLITSY